MTKATDAYRAAAQEFEAATFVPSPPNAPLCRACCCAHPVYCERCTEEIAATLPAEDYRRAASALEQAYFFGACVLMMLLIACGAIAVWLLFH